MKNRPRNGFLDDPCWGWVSSCTEEEDCECSKCEYKKKIKNEVEHNSTKIIPKE